MQLTGQIGAGRPVPQLDLDLLAPEQAALLTLIGERKLAEGAVSCRNALTGNPVLAAAAAGCLGRGRVDGGQQRREPVREASLRHLLTGLVGWKASRSERIACGFYTSQALELVPHG